MGRISETEEQIWGRFQKISKRERDCVVCLLLLCRGHWFFLLCVLRLQLRSVFCR